MALPLLGVPVRAAPNGMRVTFPERQIRLTRWLERGLSGDEMLVVSRTWECRFSSNSAGATIDARQVSVEVMAPEALAPVAEVERRREITGLFPMQLAKDGTIVGWADQDPDIDATVAAARMAIERKGLDRQVEGDAKRYVAAMSQTAASLVSQVPRDLFFPETGERREARAIELPNGESGIYELTVRTSADSASGLLKASERRIVTSVGGESRVSREVWSVG